MTFKQILKTKETEKSRQAAKDKLTIERIAEARKLEKAQKVARAKLVEKSMAELSAVSQRPVCKVVDEDIDEAEQLTKARLSTAQSMGLHSFRKTQRPITPRGPWSRNLFLRETTTVAKPKQIEARKTLAQEVAKLMAAEKVRELDLRRQLRVLLDK